MQRKIEKTAAIEADSVYIGFQSPIKNLAHQKNCYKNNVVYSMIEYII
jgi:hypothetical protein